MAKGKKESIDFSGVPKEGGGRSKHIQEGEYLLKINGVEKKWKDNDRSNVPYFNWKFQVNKGKEKGTAMFFITSLKPDALFNLRNLIFAATGKNVAGKSVGFDPQTLVGKIIGGTVEDEEYKPEGKKKSRIVSRVVDVYPKAEYEERSAEAEEEEEEDDDDAEEEDEDEDEDEEDDDEKEDEDEDLEEVDIDDL